jgi:acyl dehydratase
VDYGSELVRTIGLSDMVAYAGATWDWHRLHYDEGYARERGLRAPVVDGQMLGALMSLQGYGEVGPDFRLAQLDFRLRSMVYAGDRIKLVTRTTASSTVAVTIRHEIVMGDRIVADGKAEFRRVVA